MALFDFSFFSQLISISISQVSFNIEQLFHSLQNPTTGNTVLLSSKHGQQYQCVLPELETLEKHNEDNHVLSREEIPLLLEPLKKKCLYNVSYK